MEYQVIAMKKHAGEVEIDGQEFKITLPHGCTGMLFCFESKEAAYEYWGKDTGLIRIEEESKALNSDGKKPPE